MIARAIQIAGGGDPDKIVAALEGLKFSGANGEYVFGPNAHSGMIPASVAMAVWKGGKIVPGKPNCEGCFETIAAQ